MDEPSEDPLPDLISQAEILLRERVCSPLHRCFPPKPTICFICGYTSGASCPFRELSGQS